MSFEGERRASERLNEIHRRFAEEDHEQSVADYRELLKLPAFRRVLAGILKRARVFGSLSRDCTDPNQMMKMIGWRELGVDILFAANGADGAMVLKAIEERNAIERGRKDEILRITGNNKERNEQ